jgi:hypothetical protein
MMVIDIEAPTGFSYDNDIISDHILDQIHPENLKETVYD